MACHALNTIARESAGGRETSSAHKRYVHQILNIENLPKSMKTPEVVISFSEKYVFGVHPHNDDLMVIEIKCEEWEIKRVLVDQGSFVVILY